MMRPQSSSVAARHRGPSLLLTTVVTSALLTTASVAVAAPPTSSMSGPAKKTTAKAPLSNAQRTARADAALRRAYQKEFAYLAAEKRAVAERLDAARRGVKSARARTAQELATLEADLSAMTRAADAADDALAAQLRAGEVSADAVESLESIRGQAAVAAGLAEDAPLSAAFDATIDSLSHRSLMRIEKGTFFSAEGVQVSGVVVDIGGVAHYGVAGGTAGALAPAGSGAWKVWPASNETDARALVGANGTAPSTLGVFLAAKADVAISPPKSKTPLDIVVAGGSVAWVIVALGLLAILLAAARLMLLRMLARGPKNLEEEIFALVSEGRLTAAEQATARAAGSLARVLQTALTYATRTTREREDLVDERLLREQARADWFASALLVVAAVAPLLGLLGTVTGMISTFDAITEVGTGDPKVLAGGISEALITTELGLIVAIPTLLLGNLLNGIGERLKRRLEIAALAIQNRIDEPRLHAVSTDGGSLSGIPGGSFSGTDASGLSSSDEAGEIRHFNVGG